MTVGPDFQLDEVQDAIVRLTGEVLDGNADAPERAWKALGQAGLLSLAVPTRLGGAGLGVLETSLVLAEVGRRAAVAPALSTLALGVLPVARWGAPVQQQELLSGVGEGMVLTAALAEPSDPLPSHPRTTMTADRAVTGTKVGVLNAERAYRILVPVNLSGGGFGIALLDPTAPGVSLHRTPTSTGLAEHTVRFAAVEAELLGQCVDGQSVADLYRYAVAGACAVGDGALAGALRLTSDHLRVRHQFGRPLATFQAVAQQIADVYVTARTLHLAALSACWRLGSGRPADDELWVAAQWLTGEGPAALRSCHHLHGGLGLAADYPMHRYSSLVRDLVRMLGGAEHCLRRLGGRVVHRPS